MDLASSVRVQIRACSNTLVGETSAQNTVLHRGADKDLDGDQGAVGQRGNKGGNTLCRKLCFSNLSGGKERRGAETGNKSEVPKFLCEDRTFQDGRSTHTAPAKQLDGKMDLKDAYLQVPIHQESQHLLQFQWEDKIYQFQCLPFGLTSAQGLLEGDEACGGNPQAYGNSSSDIPRRPLDTASGEGRVDTVVSQLFEALGLVVNQAKSVLISHQRMEF